MNAFDSTRSKYVDNRKNFDLNRYLSKGGKMSKVLNMEDRYRTCCNCWHIRAGTIVLGLIELVAVSLILRSVIRQLRLKNIEQAICSEKKWRDCLNLHNFNLTMAGDYIIAIVLFSIGFCILLLFYGVLTCRPKFLLPHLIVQAVGLILSFGYFILYAWTYFYGDLYTDSKKFLLENCVERLWLSSIILVFAIFQCYLFFSVVKCSLYLIKLKIEQQRRFMQFEEVSNRVKLAKENGLWRSTSWGGGFQQYRGQYEQKPKKSDDKKQFNNRVQWNLEKNVEKTISCGMDSSFSTTLVDETENGSEKKKDEKQHNTPIIKRDVQANEEAHNNLQEKSNRSPARAFPSASSTESNNSQIPVSRNTTRKKRRSRESESSSNSFNTQFTRGDVEEIRRYRQSSSSGSPPTPKKKLSKDNNSVNIITTTPANVAGMPSASAVIYTKIAAQPSQKPLPQAVVRLRPVKFPTLDIESAVESRIKNKIHSSASYDSSRGSTWHGREHMSSSSFMKKAHNKYADEHTCSTGSATTQQPTIPRVKRISITSKTRRTSFD